MTSPHVFPHDEGGPPLGEPPVSRCAATLPLQGSNLDSSDPESDRGARPTETGEGGIASLPAAVHTVSHTVSHPSRRERPILFSAPMVRAILDGTKTQTRRVVACPFKPWRGKVYDAANWTVQPHSGGGWRAYQSPVSSPPRECSPSGFPCPYGAPGDRLWVRETWAPVDGPAYDDGRSDPAALYRADPMFDGCGPGDVAWKWKPSIHMPRWASRLTLDITDVRVERLQEISEEDARAEGVEPEFRTVVPVDGIPVGATRPYHMSTSDRGGFANLWDALNGPRGYGWDANPWVWTITFRRTEADHAR